MIGDTTPNGLDIDEELVYNAELDSEIARMKDFKVRSY